MNFFTKLDMSMQHCAFELDKESKDLCTIIASYAKFQCCWLPMGICCSLNIAQEIMEDVLREIKDAEVFTDDIGAFSKSWDQHF